MLTISRIISADGLAALRAAFPSVGVFTRESTAKDILSVLHGSDARNVFARILENERIEGFNDGHVFYPIASSGKSALVTEPYPGHLTARGFKLAPYVLERAEREPIVKRATRAPMIAAIGALTVAIGGVIAKSAPHVGIPIFALGLLPTIYGYTGMFLDQWSVNRQRKKINAAVARIRGRRTESDAGLVGCVTHPPAMIPN